MAGLGNMSGNAGRQPDSQDGTTGLFIALLAAVILWAVFSPK
jgi:hypothetical protein